MSDDIRRIIEELNRVNDVLQQNQKFLSEHLDSIRPHLETVNYVEKQLSEISIANKLQQEVFTPDLEEHFRQIGEFEAKIREVGNLIGGDISKQLSDVTAVMKENEELLASSLTGVSSNLGDVLEEVNQRVKGAKSAFEGLSLSPFLPEQDAVLDIIKSVDIGPLMAGGLMVPLENITVLKALSNAVQLPYIPESIDAINTLLGDWKGVISPPDDVLENLRSRTDFYKGLGFDSRLTALPEPIFTKTLYSTGILRHDLFSPVFPYIKEEWEYREDDEEEIVKQRMLEAYDILYSFENDIREFLDKVMAAHFGPDWMKHRVHGDVRKDWIRKREEALSNGEEEMPLLWYADFTDYIDIIVRRDNWRDVFSPIFRNQMEIQVSFQRLNPIRVCTMHTRILAKEDMLLLSVEVQRVLRAIGKIRDED